MCYADKNEVHVDILGKGGIVKCPRLSTQGGEGVKIGQNLVHVVVECPLYGIYLGILCRKWHVVCAHSSCSAKKDMATGNLHIYWETHILIGHKSNIKVYGFHK